LGWKEGEGLGKANEGILEPINVEMRVKASAGLGAYPGSHVSLDNVHRAAATERWTKAQDRYAKLTGSHPGSERSASLSQTTNVVSVKWVKGQEVEELEEETKVKMEKLSNT
jgi:hypothetical protein